MINWSIAKHRFQIFQFLKFLKFHVPLGFDYNEFKLNVIQVSYIVAFDIYFLILGNRDANKVIVRPKKLLMAS